MIKKLVSILVLVAVCTSLGSCSKVKKSGKPYINSTSNCVDGISYYTEENETDHFIAVKGSKGDTFLVPVNENKVGYYDPDGLCRVKPGEIYTITYDAQHETGGIDGRNNIYFLAVYDCEKCSYDDLFENGFYSGFYYPLSGDTKGTSFLAFKGEKGGYDVYCESFGKKHFDERREIRFPLEFSDLQEPVEMQFNVYCNSDVTDDYMIDKILNRQLDDEESFIFIDADHPHESVYDNDFEYDSIEKAAYPGYEFDYMFGVYSDTIPEECYRKVISEEELSNKTASELDLDEEVYESIKEYLIVVKGYGHDCSYDAILIGGEFYDNCFTQYDKDLKLYVITWDSGRTIKPSPYIVLFVRSEFNDILPQD